MRKFLFVLASTGSLATMNAVIAQYAPWLHGPWLHGPWLHGPWLHVAGATAQ